MTISLNGSDLTVTQVVAVARHGETVALAPEAIAAMRRSRAIVQDVLAGGEPVYGLTTGVGERKAYLLDPAERQRFNHRLVLNHRIAQGDAARSRRGALANSSPVSRRRPDCEISHCDRGLRRRAGSTRACRCSHGLIR